MLDALHEHMMRCVHELAANMGVSIAEPTDLDTWLTVRSDKEFVMDQIKMIQQELPLATTACGIIDNTEEPVAIVYLQFGKVIAVWPLC